MSAARVLFAVALALVLLISPARAQEEGTITLTLRLALRGDVPENERFAFGFEYPDHYAPGGSPVDTLLCGYDDDADDRVDIELGYDQGGNSPCEGATVYVVDRVMPKGATIHYRFSRGKASERFAAGTAVLNQDTVIGAVYTFPSSGEN